MNVSNFLQPGREAVCFFQARKYQKVMYLSSLVILFINGTDFPDQLAKALELAKAEQ